MQILREFCEREGEKIAYRKGNQLEREGDPARWFAFVTEGCFKYDKTRAKKKAYLPTIIELYTGGASYRKISELTGVHPSTVARWIKEYI